MKTKISLVLFALGLVSASAYAGTIETAPMPVSNDVNVVAPEQSGMWSFGVMAVLMQPTNKDFTYAAYSTDTFSGSGPGGTITHPKVTEGYDWWFGADVTYAFPGNGRDVTLAYEGLHGTASDSTSTNTFGALHSSFSGLAFLTAEGKTDTRYDAGDLVFGQKLDVGSRIRLHPFAGVRYAYINTNDTGSYTGGQDFDGLYSQVESAKIENTFSGIGPRFGSDAQVNLGQGFSVRGRLGLSALIGSHKLQNSATVTDYTGGNVVVGPASGTVTVADYSETRVIPEIDGRLGLNYTVDFNANTALGFELGWQATNYFNVISDQPYLGDAIGNNGGSNKGAQPGEHYDSTSNFGVQGPYARVQLDLA